MGLLDLLKAGNKPLAERFDRDKLLEHIENSATKNDFVAWLNDQHKGAFSESDEWIDLKQAVVKAGISTAELYSFASSVSSEADIKKLLRDVETQTQAAQATADKLSLLSGLKKFAVAAGGASLLAGVALIVLAVAVWSGLIVLPALEVAHLVAFGLVVGVLQLLAGLLLIVE